jgi:hypothetical protein
MQLCVRLLGRLAPESGRLRRDHGGNGGHGRDDRRRKPFMLPILINNQLKWRRPCDAISNSMRKD